MKTLLIAFVSIFLITIALPGQSSEQNSTKTHNRNASQSNKSQETQPPSPAILINGIANNTDCGKCGQPEKYEARTPTHDWMDKLNALSTTAIALLTLALVVAVFNQVRDYRLRERGWVFFFVESATAFVGGEGEGSHRITGQIKNVGSTSAIIGSSGYFGATINKGENLPPEPDYSSQAGIHNITYSLVPQSGVPVTVDMPEDEMTRVRNGDAVLYLYGFINYEDIFKKNRKTRYCFRYYPRLRTDDVHVGFFPEGPRTYHEIT